MNLTWLKNLASKLERSKDSVFSYPVEKQKAYLAHFPEPKDEIERSYFQYCCQMKMYGAFYHFVLNLAALPFSLFLLFRYRKVHLEFKEKRKCIFIRNDLPENILQKSLRERYPDFLSLVETGNCLRKEDVAFLKQIFKRYPFSWLFWMKNIIKTSQFAAVVCCYDPEVIITRDEFSFTSSAMTRFCRDMGIRRINVLHGEKLFHMHDAFVSFDEFFVWCKEYVDLFLDLRAEKEQFVVEIPPSLQIQKDDSVEKIYDFTYYLGIEPPEQMERIGEALKKLESKGFRVAVRPHPRYSDPMLVREFFDFAAVEDTKSVSIERSLLQTEYPISLHSTVLTQACYSGMNVVVDDISSPDHYAKLKELKSIVLLSRHQLLSQVLEEKVK